MTDEDTASSILDEARAALREGFGSAFSEALASSRYLNNTFAAALEAVASAGA